MIDVFISGPGWIGRGVGKVTEHPRTMVMLPREELPYDVPANAGDWFAVLAPGTPAAGETVADFLRRVDSEGNTIAEAIPCTSAAEARKLSPKYRKRLLQHEIRQRRERSGAPLPGLSADQLELAKRLFPGTAEEYVADYAFRHEDALPVEAITPAIVGAIRKRKRSKRELSDNDRVMIELTTNREEYFALTYAEKTARINRKLGTAFTVKAIEKMADRLGVPTKLKGRPGKEF